MSKLNNCVPLRGCTHRSRAECTERTGVSALAGSMPKGSVPKSRSGAILAESGQRGQGREKGEGRREKGEGRREKGEGRREKGATRCRRVREVPAQKKCPGRGGAGQTSQGGNRRLWLRCWARPRPMSRPWRLPGRCARR